MIRRLKKDVLDQLPDKRRQKVEISVDEKIVKELKKVLSGMYDVVDQMQNSKVYVQRPDQSFDDYLNE